MFSTQVLNIGQHFNTDLQNLFFEKGITIKSGTNTPTIRYAKLHEIVFFHTGYIANIILSPPYTFHCMNVTNLNQMGCSAKIGIVFVPTYEKNLIILFAFIISKVFIKHTRYPPPRHNTSNIKQGIFYTYTRN